MKRAGLWIVMGLGCLGIVLALCPNVRQWSAIPLVAEAAKEPNAKRPKPSSTSPRATAPSSPSVTVTEPASPAAGEKVIYTFPDEAKMRDFTQLWQQRQGILLRMNVLQAYWSEEQAALTQLNNKLAIDYKIDTTKNYVLNSEKRELVEREPQSPQAPSTSPAGL